MIPRFSTLLIACTLAACGSDGESGDRPDSSVIADAGVEAEAGADSGDCAGSGVSKGPWTLAIDEASARIRWEACRAGVSPKLTLTPELGGAPITLDAAVTETELTGGFVPVLNPNAPPDVPGTYWLHDAHAKGLAPGSCYRYELDAESTASGRFCTARTAGEPFTFAAIGDTHPGLSSDAVLTMARVVDKGFDFSLHTGDIQYYSGAFESWASWFGSMAPWLRQGGFFPSIGNHEQEDQNPSELEEFYLRLFGGAGFDGTDRYYRFQSGGVWFFALDTESDVGAGSAQADWFATQIAGAAAQPGYRFSVVYFHKPFLTCGDKSQDDAARGHYQPLFEQHGVALVLQGHMHGYERFELNGVTYVTTAGGGGLMGNVDENIARPECALRQASGPWIHAMWFEVGASTLRGSAVDKNGQLLDGFEKSAPSGL
jgi:acid phosphatase type 7